MDYKKEQELLLRIVSGWNHNEKPEYRGFRCGNCQKYVNKAWYHWLNSGGFKHPVHLCDNGCEQKFQAEKIKRDPLGNTFSPNAFPNSYPFKQDAIKRFEEIINSWPVDKLPKLKSFFCDGCGKDLDMDKNDSERKGFHVWWKTNDGILAELHSHKKCGNKLGII